MTPLELLFHLCRRHLFSPHIPAYWLFCGYTHKSGLHWINLTNKCHELNCQILFPKSRVTVTSERILLISCLLLPITHLNYPVFFCVKFPGTALRKLFLVSLMPLKRTTMFCDHSETIAEVWAQGSWPKGRISNSELVIQAKSIVLLAVFFPWKNETVQSVICLVSFPF